MRAHGQADSGVNFGWLSIRSSSVLRRVESSSYPSEPLAPEHGRGVLVKSPNGYAFRVLESHEESASRQGEADGLQDPVEELPKLEEAVRAGGHTVVSSAVQDSGQTAAAGAAAAAAGSPSDGAAVGTAAILTPLVLADPDGHEICFLGVEGFSQLLQLRQASQQNSLSQHISGEDITGEKRSRDEVS
eukprot:jgi/Mesen1/7104/ME000369S06436